MDNKEWNQDKKRPEQKDQEKHSSQQQHREQFGKGEQRSGQNKNFDRNK